MIVVTTTRAKVRTLRSRDVHVLEPPALSVVATTDDQSLVDKLERVLGAAVELIIVSTRPVRGAQVRALEVFPLESSYRRNRGLLLSGAPVVAFLEDGQLPSPDWAAVSASAFTGDRPAAAAITDAGVAYHRDRLLAEH